ncbi:MAG: 4-hydroxythreonine-4-phosphate dehydrogenase PdxA [Candidatus Omnitrophica bacterium]|nr:4-hydroxythreonine-4-phosphate dehydrogenase PdxA [Candidatus Omnitrophota bacterium]
MTGGDPCGIGPEVILKSLTNRSPQRVRLVIIGDVRVFEQTAKRLRRRLPRWDATLNFVDVAHRATFHPGRSDSSAGRAALDYLEAAVALWREGSISALVTAPVTKWAIERIQPGFVGHTEYLGGVCGVPHPVMMVVSSRLRVVLLTRHRALHDVASQMTRPLLRATLKTTIDGLQAYFGLRRPRIAICGLNPHAGERGAFGDEEQRILAPVLRALGTDRAHLEGPFAADGFFVDPKGYDAVVCWYHDQGLIPFKMMARDRGCQLTLGLPIIRTSPDHGSALAIAGKGVAHPGSMRYAIELAARLAGKSGTQTNRGHNTRSKKLVCVPSLAC